MKLARDQPLLVRLRAGSRVGPERRLAAPPPPGRRHRDAHAAPQGRLRAVRRDGRHGRGAREQYDVATQMAAFHEEFPFDFVIMLGDNIYGADTPADMANKFETPYKPLLDAGVVFRAVLGNHDNPNQRFYKPFNMGGERYYTFRASKRRRPTATEGGVRFFALDTNYLDKPQLDWLEKELAGLELRLEDRVLPSPALLVRQDPRLLARIAGGPRAALRQVRRERRVLRARPLLRAHQAPEGRHRVLGVRRRRLAAQGRHPRHGPDRQGLRHRLPLHARGDHRRRPVLPGDQPDRRDGRQRSRAPAHRTFTVNLGSKALEAPALSATLLDDLGPLHLEGGDHSFTVPSGPSLAGSSPTARWSDAPRAS